MQRMTQWLDAARSGDRAAIDQMFVEFYDDFRRIAHARLRHSAPLTLMQTTALVNDAYLRLVRVGRIDAENRAHFLAYAARVMRSIVVDLVRERVAQRRGGGIAEVTLDTGLAESVPAAENEILQVSDALNDLAKVDERLVRIVELRYFAGLTEMEIGVALGMSERTVRRLWEKARVLLSATLREG